MTQAAHCNTSAMLNCASQEDLFRTPFLTYGGKHKSTSRSDSFFFSWWAVGFYLISLGCFVIGWLPDWLSYKKYLTWVTVLFLERKYALHSAVYCKHWWVNEVIKKKKKKRFKYFNFTVDQCDENNSPCFSLFCREFCSHSYWRPLNKQ